MENSWNFPDITKNSTLFLTFWQNLSNSWQFLTLLAKWEPWLIQNKITWQQFVKSIRMKVRHIYSWSKVYKFIWHLKWRSDHIILCSIKDFLNNNKIFVEQKNNSNYKWRSRKWCNKHDMKKAYFTSTT